MLIQFIDQMCHSGGKTYRGQETRVIYTLINLGGLGRSSDKKQAEEGRRLPVHLHFLMCCGIRRDMVHDMGSGRALDKVRPGGGAVVEVWSA